MVISVCFSNCNQLQQLMKQTDMENWEHVAACITALSHEKTWQSTAAVCIHSYTHINDPPVHVNDTNRRHLSMQVYITTTREWNAHSFMWLMNYIITWTCSVLHKYLRDKHWGSTYTIVYWLVSNSLINNHITEACDNNRISKREYVYYPAAFSKLTNQ